MKSALSFVVIVLAAFLAGCSEEAPVDDNLPVAPAGPRKAPNERVLSDFYKKSGLAEPLPSNPDAMMTKSAAERLVKSVAELQKASTRAEDPDAIVNEVADRLSANIKEAEGKKMWSFVPAYVEAYQVLRPEDKLFASYIDRAQQQLTRPRIALRGLYRDHNSGMTTASIKLFNPITRETTTENIRLGEELNGLRFTSVIGKDEGINLEIPSNGMTFQILKGEDLK